MEHRAYYNEINPYCVEWLRNLISAGHIALGDVDDRSIEDVSPSDLIGYTQCHFFAGIGGWQYALRLAGWKDTRPVWTGSCPCQPFSTAGKEAGLTDQRHLWPAWFHLIEQCSPDVIFGEQVEAAIRFGWLALVQTDLEGIGYSTGAISLPAASVGAPHKRDRLWFVADSDSGRCNRGHTLLRKESHGSIEAARGSETSGPNEHMAAGDKGQSNALGNPQYYGRDSKEEEAPEHGKEHGGVFDRGYSASPWKNPEWVKCRDNRTRPFESGSFPVAYGIPNRMEELRAYGNAIVPQVAAEVIKAYMNEPYSSKSTRFSLSKQKTFFNR